MKDVLQHYEFNHIIEEVSDCLSRHYFDKGNQ